MLRRADLLLEHLRPIGQKLPVLAVEGCVFLDLFHVHVYAQAVSYTHLTLPTKA